MTPYIDFRYVCLHNTDMHPRRTSTHEKLADTLLADGRTVRPKEFLTHGVPASVLMRMLGKKRIVRIDTSDGVLVGYRSVEAPPLRLREDKLATIAIRHPGGVLCLQSALRFHDLTDGYDEKFAVAVGPKSNRTSTHDLRFVVWSETAMFETGVVETVVSGGVKARITDVPRTLADLFRPAHRMSDSIRMEALRAVVRHHGEECIRTAAAHAMALGWWKEMQPVMQTIEAIGEAMPCAATRRP